MLAKPRRVRQAKDYRRAFHQGQILRGQRLTVRIVPTDGPHHRFGFIVSTKTAKRATDRNRLKRRLRSIAAAINIPSQPKLDVVVTALTPATSASYDDLRQDLLQLLTHRHAPRRRLPH